VLLYPQRTMRLPQKLDLLESRLGLCTTPRQTHHRWGHVATCPMPQSRGPVFTPPWNVICSGRI